MNEHDQHNPRLLAIDDSILIHRLLKTRLCRERVELHGALSGREGLSIACTLQPDCILLDLDMPDLSGFEVLHGLKADPETRDIPVIIISGSNTSEEKVRALDLGAIDFVTKPFDLAELKARVRSAVRQRRLVRMLAQRARVDGTTGLWNRMYFDERLEQEIGAALRHGEPLSLVMADLDHFKHVNDTLGHPFGDRVLEEFSLMLLAGRGEDIACRYGGEEFVIIVPHVDAEAAARVAERHREILERHRWDHQGSFRITASFGVADLDRVNDPSASALVNAADAALYRAKNTGRNRVEIAPLVSRLRRTA